MKRNTVPRRPSASSSLGASNSAVSSFSAKRVEPIRRASPQTSRPSAISQARSAPSSSAHLRKVRNPALYEDADDQETSEPARERSAQPAQWRTGPLHSRTLEPSHGRPIYCMSIKNGQLVTGSADHGLRVYDIHSGSFQRELFSKQYGHTEWVTTCAQLDDGRILSGGMDSQLCLWDARAVRCHKLSGHQGSISKVQVDDKGIGLSASYDSTILVWDLNTRTGLQSLGNGHKMAVLDFEWIQSLVVSSGRDGTVCVWDVNRSNAIQKFAAHQGPAAKVRTLANHDDVNVFMSAGGQDGKLCVWDMRTHSPVFNQQIHKGCINEIVASSLSMSVVTASADKSMRILEPRVSFAVRAKMDAQEALYCAAVAEDVAVGGAGDGNLYFFDMQSAECIYGFGASEQGAVQCVGMTEDMRYLIAGGDDGKAMVLKYV